MPGVDPKPERRERCDLCAAEVGPAAFFCARCGDLIRRPPPGAPLAAPWRALLAAPVEARDTMLGAPAVAFDDHPSDAPPPPPPERLSEAFDAVPLDPPEGFRETAWFLDGEDPEALSAIENDDLPAAEHGARYRTAHAVVDERDRRRLSLAADDDALDEPPEEGSR